MERDELAFLPAVELVQLLREREVSSRELLELYLERTDAINPSLNAIVTLDADTAYERAAEADEASAHGQSWGPLHGLPITVKDVFETAGLRTTAGSTDLRDYVPDRDATLVGRLRRAGAIVFGKTNTPSMAADGQTFNELFGTTNNPWDLTRTPGGSSGGCGAAVASAMTPISFGSDVAGSIRVPANFCGLYGHKATHGLIPQRGHIPGPPGQLAERDINVVGPIARDARDLDLALSVLAGPISQEALSWRMELPPPPGKELGELRIAAWLDDESCPVDDTVTERLDALVAALGSAGAIVDTEVRPIDSFADAFDMFFKLRGQSDLSHGEWAELDEQRQRYRESWAQMFEHYDVLICPVCSTPPFPHDQRPRAERSYVINGEERPYTEYVAWPGLIGLVLLPSTAIPLGSNSNGLPVGAQVVGPHLADRRTIDVARRISEVIGGFERPPGF